MNGCGGVKSIFEIVSVENCNVVCIAFIWIDSAVLPPGALSVAVCALGSELCAVVWTGKWRALGHIECVAYSAYGALMINIDWEALRRLLLPIGCYLLFYDKKRIFQRHVQKWY